MIGAARRRLTYANVVSSVSLFLVLGGSAYAAASITGKQIANGSVSSADIKDHSLLAKDFKTGELKRGPAGPVGPQGPAGPAGPKGDAAPVPPPPAAKQPAGTILIDGVQGDGPGGAIPVRSLVWSNTATVGTPGTGGGAGKATFGDFVITKAPDRSSPVLFRRTATAERIKQATIQLTKPGSATPYATYTLKDLVVKSFATAGRGAEREDQFVLSFSKLLSDNPAFAFNAAAPLPGVAEPRVGRMTVDGIPGSIDLTLNSWVAVNTGGQPAPQIGPFAVSKAIDGTSAALLQRFRAGEHTKKVTIELPQPGSETVFSTHVLSDTVLTQYDVAGGNRPLERLAFDAARIESIVPLPGGGSVRSCFDRKTNATC